MSECQCIAALAWHYLVFKHCSLSTNHPHTTHLQILQGLHLHVGHILGLPTINLITISSLTNLLNNIGKKKTGCKLRLFRMWRVVILVCIAAARAELAEEEDSQRQDRVLSVFNVVTFPNSACGASNGYNGTCYTSSGTNAMCLEF